MHFLQSNFNGGLFTPLMIGRPDVATFKTGALQLENFVVRPYGGVFKAPGTELCGEVKDSSKPVRLVPFRVSDTEQYYLELGENYMRFWRDNFSGNPEYLTTSSDSTKYYLDGTDTYPIAVGVILKRSGSLVMITQIFKDNTTITYDATPWTAGVVYELATPWLAADLGLLQWQQINREMIFVHPNYPPWLLEIPGDKNNKTQSVYWSGTSPGFNTGNLWSLAPVNFTFPPLRESTAIGSGHTVTLDINLTAWALSTAYSVGTKRKNKGIAFVCTVAMTSGQNIAATEPGVGASWQTKWRVATSAEFDVTLTASDTSVFSGVVVGDDFIVEPPVTGRSVALQLSSTTALGPTSATFIQGAFVVRSEWPSGEAVTGTVTLEQSFDNSRWESAREWNLPTVNAGTIAFSGEAPAEGAWYRLKALLTAPGTAATTKQAFIEPVSSMMKLALRVRSITSTTVLVVDSGLPNRGTLPPEAMGVAATSFYLSAFCGQNGYPGAIAFHNLRLWLGGTAKEPNRLRSSAVNDFFNFSTGSSDDAGMDITLAATDSSDVKWIASYRQGLVVGTGGEEWTVQGGDGTEILKPTNIQAIRRSRSGSKALAPIQTRDALLWVSATGRKLLEFAYVFTSDKYEAPDMTLRAEQITAGGIVEMAFASEPDPVLWCVCGDGRMAGFSYNRQNEITAWFERTTVNGLFENVASIGGTSGRPVSGVWTVVNRTINGNTKRYIERFAPAAQAFDFGSSESFWYVDCGIYKVPGPSHPNTHVSGLEHLEGETVSVYTNGVAETHTVVGGEITLSTPSYAAIVGLPMTSTVQSMPLDITLQDGTAQGRNWRPNRVDFILHASEGGRFADAPDGTYYDIEYPLGGAPYVFTGRITQHVGANWEELVQFVVTHADPFPFNMLGYVIIAEVEGS